MKYVETAAGGVVCVSVAELCFGRQTVNLSASDAESFAFLPGMKQNGKAQALVELNGIKFLVSAEADGWLEGENGSLGTLVEFFVAKPGKSQSACPQPSPYGLCCAAVFAAAGGADAILIRRALISPALDGAYSVCENRYEAQTLNDQFYFRLGIISKRAEFEINRAENVLPGLKKLKFPHSALREGQRELIERTYTALKQKERLFAQAPTGIGKTVSVLYGAARAMADGKIRRLFYLTAKTSVKREAFASTALLDKAGAGLRAVVLAAKEDMCPLKKLKGPGFACDGTSCPLMNSYHSRAGNAIGELLENYRGYPVKTVLAAAEKAGVCPYELSLDLSEYCDIVICDYNSVFDPGVRLQRYFGYGDCSDAALLIDEAHNLPTRAREIFSGALTTDDLEAFRPFITDGMKIYSVFDRMCKLLEGLRPLCAENSVKHEDGSESGWYYSTEQPAELGECASLLVSELIVLRAIHREEPELFAAAGVLLRKCAKWAEASNSFDSHFRTYIEINHGKLSAKLFCLDPSERLDETLSRVRASVFFSATLTPSDYFADILGGKKNASELTLPSPFPEDNLFIAAVTSVDTRYSSRDKSAKRICAAIAASVSAKKGNYIVFFPSYAYLDAVTKLFTEKYRNVKVKIQKPGMGRREREEFLDFFADDRNVLRVGFCVLGGMFSEGVDLPGGRLIGTVIVGVGLPGLSAESNIIKEYYDLRSECGFDYAYTYPGMNSVLQAAGRVIRTDSDVGAVILIDDRYAEPRYKALMPPHWKKIKYVQDLRELPSQLAEFWNKRR